MDDCNTDGRKELQERYDYYKEESERGYVGYHNPYEYDDEMTMLLNLSCIEYNSEEYMEWETKIHNIGMEFWGM